MITVIGLGYAPGDITLKASEYLRKAKNVIVKTSRAGAFSFFKDNNIKVVTMDEAYERAEDFDALNQIIAQEVLKYKDAAYCVEGSGSDDLSVIELKKCSEITVIPGLPREADALAVTPQTAYNVLFATDFINMRAFYPDGNFALIIKEIDNFMLASDVKLKLLKLIGDAPAYVIRGGKSESITIAGLDRNREFDHTSTLLVPLLGNYHKERYNFSDLMEITYRLRDPDGCKWDKAQTHETIRANAIEEAYELVEAVDLKDPVKMCEETGDVILQGVFHAVLGENAEEYDINDSLTVLCAKLIGRHTHIFGDVKADNSAEALKAWEAAKAVEKGYETYSDKLKGIAANLPALMRAYKVQKAAKKSGFDWPDISGAIAKVHEELNELMEADAAHKEEEGGDLIFAAVNVLRFLSIDPEIALNGTIRKFINRFGFMEGEILKTGRKLEECTLEEMDKYWELGKHVDR